jgi:hypothetical protein
MRFVAILLLISSFIISLRAATDRVDPDCAVRSLPQRLLLLAIARPAQSSPVSPARREPAIESALDEEESSDLDPLGPAAQNADGLPLATTRPAVIAATFPSRPPMRPGHPGPLRC